MPLVPAEKKKWVHGRCIVDGVPQFTSVSQIEKADQSKESGCLRRWWFVYVLGRKEEQSGNQERGVRLHEQSANYLLTGNRARLDGAIIRNLFMYPEPGLDLHIEKSIVPIGASGEEDLTLAPLRIAGFPAIGAIDVRHRRGINKGAAEDQDPRDPPNTVEVLDWKFVGDLRFTKTGPELAKTIQMIGYGEYAFNVDPAAEHVRLSHGYIPKSGQGRKATVLVDRETISRAMEHLHAVGRSVRDAAAEKDPNKVPANTQACNSYNRPCPHKAYCTAGQVKSLASLVGKKSAEALIRGEKIPVSNPGTLLTRVMSAAPPKTSLLGARTAAAPAKPAVDPAELARLKAEELAAKIPAGFADSLAAVDGFGMGLPSMSGAVAVACHAVNGVDSSADIAGRGEIAHVELSAPGQMAELLAELRAAAASSDAVIDTGLLPPDAPENDPALAAEPIEAESPLAAIRDKAVAAGKGRPKGSKNKPKAEVVAEATAAVAHHDPDVALPVNEVNTIAAESADLVIYIGCAPVGRPTADADALARQLITNMCSHYELADVRNAGKESPLAYGGWKAIFTATIVESADTFAGDIVCSGLGEFSELMAEALGFVADKRGALIVRGTK